MGKKPRFHCDVRASFAAVLSRWRQEKKLPLKQVARDLGVSISTVSSWESGEYFPTGYNFEVLVEYTGLAPCQLLCVMAEECVPGQCLLSETRVRKGRAERGGRIPV
jgi:transcriptional regulator with XRE-family HTH domain